MVPKIINNLAGSQHGVFVPTPTGDLTVVHFMLCDFLRIATSTGQLGGTWIIIVDDQAALFSNERLNQPIGSDAPDDVRPSAYYWVDRMLEDLNALGVYPTGLADPGISQIIGGKSDSAVFYESDFTQLTQHYYELLGYQKAWGPWDPDLSRSLSEQAGLDTVYTATVPSELMNHVNLSCARVHHPFVTLRAALAAMITGRTFTLDGYDVLPTIIQITEKAFELSSYTGLAVPEPYFMPVVSYRTAEGDVRKVSSSWGDLPVRKAIEAGATKEDISDWLYSVIGVPGTLPIWRGNQVVPHIAEKYPAAYGAAIRSDAIIDHYQDWCRFLETGQAVDPNEKRRHINKIYPR